MKALIISNGLMDDSMFYKSKINEFDYIICADGAIKHCIDFEIYPDLWIGDFDSCDYTEFCNKNPELKEIPTLTFNKMKDETDTHIACMLAHEKGYKDIVIWGALGKRADHMMSNIHLLEWLYNRGINAVIEDKLNTMTVFDSIYQTKKIRKYISLIPLDSSVFVVETQGLLYPLKNFLVSREISLGVSNEVISENAYVKIQDGLMLVIHSDD